MLIPSISRSSTFSKKATLLAGLPSTTPSCCRIKDFGQKTTKGTIKINDMELSKHAALHQTKCSKNLACGSEST